MGLTHVAVTIKSFVSQDAYTADFLVDTGAMDSMAPASELRKIGIEPAGKKTYELANGELVEYQFGLAQFSFMDEIIASRIIFGPNDTEPILGVIALESVGFIVDPASQRLKKLPALPLKRVA